MPFDSYLPRVELLSKLESILSNPAAACSTKFMSYSKSLSFQQSSQHLHQEQIPSQEITFFAHP